MKKESLKICRILFIFLSIFLLNPTVLSAYSILSHEAIIDASWKESDPTPETEEIFEKSFNITLTQYRKQLTNVPNKKVILLNENFDVGKITLPGEYNLADETYAELLNQLAERNFSTTSNSLRRALLNFYSHQKVFSITKKIKKNVSEFKKS